MSDPGKAVFLSYASQDAEAAKRICDALRAAGVEVWFDQSELVGGDAWDQKIRKQIKECALFIPILSQTTQGRREAYFRLEWKLADERTHLMARGTPFLLPVTIDATNDREALVPDSFLAVQWTKLPGGETSPAFVARVQKLLGGSEREVGGPRSAAATAAAAGPRWIKPILASAAIVIAVLAFTLITRRGAEPAATAAAPVATEAQQLVARVWELLNKPDLGRAELSAADDMCKRAAGLAPVDAEVLAAWSQADSWSVYLGFDTSLARRESARTKMERALQFAAKSFEARLARACYLVRGRAEGGISRASPETEPLLRALLQERPAEPRALLALAICLRDQQKYAGARTTLEELARNPAFAVLAWNEIGWNALFVRDIATAEAAADKSIALQPCWPALCLKLQIVLFVGGDLDESLAALRKLPESALQEDYGAMLAAWVYTFRREWDNSVRVLAGVSREWLHSPLGDGPRSGYIALMHHYAGRDAPAEVEWRAALKLIEQRLAETPNEPALLWWKGTVLAALGDHAGGEKLLTLSRALGNPPLESEGFDRLWLGQKEEALTCFEQRTSGGILPGWFTTAAAFRLDPRFDSLRGLPRFQALQARLDADPLFSGAARKQSLAAVAPPARDDKSVAVLAFTNLSDDKANEYFSDGISEELLNVLAKIPDLKVSARTSAFSFKGREIAIPEIARQLGVAYVVEGSVRKQGDKVRITAQLIKAADGFHVWSDTFTRDLKDIFAVQDEIAGLIAKNLSLKLGMVSPPAARAVDPEAYRLMLAGRDLLYRGGAGDLEQAQRYLQDAVGRDEKFALAWAWLSIVRWAQAANGWAPIESGFQSARDAAEKALALQPDLPEANTAVGFIYYGYDWDWARARTAFDRTLALAPGDAVVLSNLTRLAITLGENDEAVRLGRQAVALDPLNSYAQYVLSMALLQAGRYAELEQQVMKFKSVTGIPVKQQVFALVLLGKNEEALRVAGELKNDNNRTFVLALANWACGHRAEADASLARLKTEYAATAAYQIAELHAYRGETEEAFAWLEMSYRQRDTGMIYVKNDPWLKSLHADPRWAATLKKMNLTDEQVK